MEKKLTLKQIYLRALAEGLTAKEASFKYKVNCRSLMTRGSEYQLPPLLSHWDWEDQRSLKEMSTNDLLILKEKFNNWIQKIDHALTQKNEENKPDGQTPASPQ